MSFEQSGSAFTLVLLELETAIADCPLEAISIFRNMQAPNFEILLSKGKPGISFDFRIVGTNHIHRNLQVFQSCIELTFRAAIFLNHLVTQGGSIPRLDSNFLENMGR